MKIELTKLCEFEIPCSEDRSDLCAILSTAGYATRASTPTAPSASPPRSAPIWAANEEKGAQGGITGFQVGAVMWEFIRRWEFTSNKTGLKILNYDNMLYPQMADKFEKKISRGVWNLLQKEAKERLEKDGESAADSVVAHWRSIVAGKVPFGYVVKD